MENEAVIVNKFETIEKCINRVKEEYENNPDNLDDLLDFARIILNLKRSISVCFTKMIMTDQL